METPPKSIIAESGLSQDELLLRAQGHKGELPRQFSFATVALALSMTNSWIGYSATFAYPLSAGGAPTVFWGLIVASVACTFITAGLAELASAYPSSGGQYHFAFMVASPKTRAATAFLAGWLSTIAWCLTTASTAIVCAQIVGVLASFWNSDFVAAQWQIYLMFVLIMVSQSAISILLPKANPRGESAFFLCSLVRFVIFLMTVLATSKTKQPARVISTDFQNVTGWGDGTAFVLAVGTCMYAFLAIDGATYIVEELPDPGRNVPRAMLLTIAIGFITVLPWTIALLFSTNDLIAVTSSALPILEVYYQALNSQAGATVFLVWLLFIYWGAGISCIVTSGRLAWAFARDNGLPYSPVFAKVHPGLEMPVNATLACTGFILLYGLIYVGSTTAFNSIISMAILSLNVTYMLPQAILLVRGRKILPPRHFDLGPILGPFCNAFSTAWVALYVVLFCLPGFNPPTVANMNYVSVVIAGVCVIILLMWFGGKRKTFSGPEIHLEGIDAIHSMSISKDPENMSVIQEEVITKFG